MLVNLLVTFGLVALFFAVRGARLSLWALGVSATVIAVVIAAGYGDWVRRHPGGRLDTFLSVSGQGDVFPLLGTLLVLTLLLCIPSALLRTTNLRAGWRSGLGLLVMHLAALLILLWLVAREDTVRVYLKTFPGLAELIVFPHTPLAGAAVYVVALIATLSMGGMAAAPADKAPLIRNRPMLLAAAAFVSYIVYARFHEGRF